MRKGNGYLGTSKIEVSTVNQEIIPESPSHWTVPYSIYKMSFLNRQDAVILINGETEIYLEAGQGFEMNEIDAPITSFIIKTGSVNYTFIAAF